MRITVTSVFVANQDKALAFYTDVLGFVKQADVPVGEYRWLTVASPEEPGGTQLLLEPNANPVAQAYQQGIHAQGIPATSFGVDDIAAEYARLTARGVQFTQPPTAMGPVTTAIFDDTCGNLIQIAQA